MALCSQSSGALLSAKPKPKYPLSAAAAAFASSSLVATNDLARLKQETKTEEANKKRKQTL
jgi:hypothetical protein